MKNKNEWRIGNCVRLMLNHSDYSEFKIELSDLNLILNESSSNKYHPIPITKENIEKYIDWSFEFGFNKSIVDKEHWTETRYLMENCIEGSSDFEIVFSDSKHHDMTEVEYYIDDILLVFGLDDNLHNLQNLFYISNGQELPIKL